MSEQPAADVTKADVERVVRRDFAADAVEEALAMLEEYGPEEWHREPDRVRIACLKLAQGSVVELRVHLEIAKTDYRDVVSIAEYPSYAKRQFHIQELPAEERQRVIDADWRQYHEWLTRA